MKYESTIFPSQKIPQNQKNEEWGKRCVDYIVGMSEVHPGGSGQDFDEMNSYYDLYNSIFDEKDLKYVTDPFDQEDGFPASPQNFNIIKPKIDLLIGEESKRPFNMRVARTSHASTTEMQERMKSMVIDYMFASVMSGMSEEEAAIYQEKIQNGEIVPPDKIVDFMSRTYKDRAEKAAYHTMNNLKEKLNLPHEFNKGFADLLKVSKEVFYNGVINGSPSLERVDPRYFSHDRSPDLEFIEDGDWACRKMRMSYTEAYDRLFDKMSEADLDKLLELTNQEPSTGRYGKDMPIGDYVHLDTKVVGKDDNTGLTDANVVDVWHTTWKSYKKVGFLSYLDENGEVQETIVSENYMVVGTELDLKWNWIIDVWEGYRVGSELYIGVQPIEYQHVSIDNPNSQKLPYFGISYGNKSLVAIMKPLQYMYIIIWYRLELALARDKGKILTMDITQIPKSMNIDPAKWAHYISSIGVNFINPYEEGWDIPGREGGKPAAFNQITEVDLSMANVIGEYINIMSKIEDMVSEISGVSKQRQGSISSSELVGNVERSVQQSAYITESLFWIHSQCKKNALRGLLNTAKECWKNSEKKSINYIMDDATRVFIELTDDFFYEDFDIFVTDSTKEMQNIEMIKSLYQPAMQNGATLLDIAEIMLLENVSEIKGRLADIEKKRSEMEQNNANSENERQMQLIQAQNEAKAAELDIRQQELELEKYKIDADNQTRIYVAELNAYRGSSEMDSDNNGIPDPIEIANISLKQREMDASSMDKQMQIYQKENERSDRLNIESQRIAMQERLEKQKIALEEKKLSSQEKLQSMKDKAALEREKIKAATARKNKVVGEK